MRRLCGRAIARALAPAAERERHAEPSRDGRALGLQRQLLRRFGSQRGRPPLAGRLLSGCVDADIPDGGLRRAEGFPPSHHGARAACCSPRATPRCIRKSSSKPARSGITWSGTGSRSAISARASNWRAIQEEPGQKPTGARFLTNVPMPDPLYRNTSREYPHFNMNIPDQFRAAQFIAGDGAQVREGRRAVSADSSSSTCPTITWPTPRPEDGYPYRASFVADNDYALGRIVEYLSHHAAGGARWRYS